ncbi:MAG: hypothetical protein KDB14_01940 [Planctomycetales bacterium]|nr:hypothetical protein [Planctomycetales bacterium]
MMDRRSGRRRRVLLDESRNDDVDAAHDDEAGCVAGYSESALQQPSLTDLIPVRPLRVCMTVLGGACVMLGLLVLDDWASNGRSIRAFQLGEPGSLASWVASTMLLWAAAGAMLTYLIRRHRKDDYRGAYYVWLWAAGLLVLTSISATSPWHLELNAFLQRLTAVDLGPHGWWLTTAGGVAGLMLVRMCFEVRQCRVALALLLLASAGYVFATLVQLEVVLADRGQLSQLCSQFGVLVSHLTLAYAVWWNARYVQLDARGVHTERAERRAAAQAAKHDRRQQRLTEKEAAREQKRQAKAKRTSASEADEEQDGLEAKPPRATTKPRRSKSSESQDEAEEPKTLSLESKRAEKATEKAESKKERKQKRRMAA